MVIVGAEGIVQSGGIINQVRERIFQPKIYTFLTLPLKNKDRNSADSNSSQRDRKTILCCS